MDFVSSGTCDKDRNDPPAALLAAYGLYPCPAIHGFICAPCGAGFRSSRISKHLRSREHPTANEDSAPLFAAIESISNSFPDNHVLRKVYFGEDKTDVPVPALLGLPIVNARNCLKCDSFFATEKTLYRHMRSEHGVVMKASEIRSIAVIPAQRLSKKSGTKLFPVILQASNETSADCQGSLQLSVCLENYEPDAVAWPEAVAVDDREHTPFMYVAKPQYRLQQVGVTMQAAVRLVQIPDVESKDPSLSVWKTVCSSLLKYYKDTKAEASEGDLFPELYLDVATPGATTKSRHFVFLSNDREATLKNYTRHCASIIMMAYRVGINSDSSLYIFLRPELQDAMSLLIMSLQNSLDDVVQNLHIVLQLIFFEEGSTRSAPRDMFMYAYLACICVQGGKTPRFRFGKEVSPILSGVLHFASVVALKHVLKSRVEKRNGNELKIVQRCMKPGGSSAVSLICDLRSLCTSVRNKEVENISYEPCYRHRLCAYMDGIELSVPRLGGMLRSLNSEIKSQIFGEDGLFQGATLPPDFRSKLLTLVDKTSELKPGYWFGADQRNKDFMSLTMQWLKTTSVLRMDDSEAVEWLKISSTVVEKMCCAVHVSGGAPARGTELGVVRFRNSNTGPRTILFATDEALVVPDYDKMRNMHSGSVRFITRHLDVETTFLVKSFLVLVQPVMTSILEQEDKKSFMEMARRENEGKDWNTYLTREDKIAWNRRRDSLFVDVVSPKMIPLVITRIFKDHGVNLNFSQYRHWHTGYAIRRSRETKFSTSRSCYADEEEDLTVEHALVLQGSHSRHTARSHYARIESYFGGSASASEIGSLEVYHRASNLWHEDLGVRSYSSRLEANDNEDCRALPYGHPASLIDTTKVSNLESSQIAESGNISSKPHISEEHRALFRLLRRQIGVQGVMSLISESQEAKGDNILGKSFNALKSLRRSTMNENAVFASAEQETAMNAVWNRESDLVIILPTGGGKTAVIQGPMFFEKRITVWISPLKGLLMDTLSRFRKVGLNAVQLPDFSIGNCEETNLLLASPEDLLYGDILQNTMESLSNAGNIQRIVIDEAHLIPRSHEYRSCMGMMRHIRRPGSSFPIVLLTATAPPALVERMCMATGCRMNRLRVVRGSIGRENLSIKVKMLTSGSRDELKKQSISALSRLIHVREATIDKRSAKVILACLTRSDSEEFATGIDQSLRSISTESLKVVIYHSKLDSPSRKQSAEAWQEHDEGLLIMVCTEAFLTGIDAPDVRMAIFAGGARSLIDFWQASGRAGRDGAAADVVVLYHGAHVRRGNAGADVEPGSEQAQFVTWAESTSTCRRRAIEEYLGDSSVKEDCISRENVATCDVCTSTSRNRTLRRVDEHEAGNSALGEHQDSRENLKTSTRLLDAIGVCKDDERAVSRRALIPRESTKRPLSLPSSEIEVRKRPALDPSEKKFPNTSRARILEEINYLYEEGKILVEICPLCRVDDTMRGKILEPRQKHNHDVNLCMRSRQSSKMDIPRCFKCLQSGHGSNTCRVVIAQETKACWCCRMLTYGGIKLHVRGEFGRNCPFAACLKFVLCFWGRHTFSQKKEIARRVSEREFHVEVRAVEELDEIMGKWLLADGFGTRPGLGRAFKWTLESIKKSS